MDDKDAGATSAVSSVDPLPPGAKHLPSDNIHFVNIAEGSTPDDQSPLSVFVVNDVVETKVGGVFTTPSNTFQIPVLPRGSSFVINILSTWGDPYYVGLMGIDLFDATGHLVAISNPGEI